MTNAPSLTSPSVTHPVIGEWKTLDNEADLTSIIDNTTQTIFLNLKNCSQLTDENITALALAIRKNNEDHLISLNLTGHVVTKEQMTKIHSILFEEKQSLTNFKVKTNPKLRLSYFVNDRFGTMSPWQVPDESQRSVFECINQIILGQKPILRRVSPFSFLQFNGLLEGRKETIINAVNEFRKTKDVYWALGSGVTDEAIADYLQFKPLIHLAAIFGRNDVITTLLKSGVISINQVDKDGHTPLYLAVKHNNAETTALLRNMKADPFAGRDRGIEGLLEETCHLVLRIIDFGGNVESNASISGSLRSSTSARLGGSRSTDWVNTIKPELEELAKNIKSYIDLISGRNPDRPICSSSSSSSSQDSASSSSSQEPPPSLDEILYQELVNYQASKRDFEAPIIEFDFLLKIKNQLHTTSTKALFFLDDLKFTSKNSETISKVTEIFGLIENLACCIELLRDNDQVHYDQLIKDGDLSLSNARKILKQNLIMKIRNSQLPPTDLDNIFKEFLKEFFHKIGRDTYDDHSRKLLEVVIEKDLIGSLGILLSFGSVPDQDSEERKNLVNIAFKFGSIQTAKLLLFDLCQTKGLSDLLRIVGEVASRRDYNPTVQALCAQVKNITKKLIKTADQAQAHEIAFAEIEKVLDIDLIRKRELLFASRNGLYFQEFDRLFNYNLNLEFDGMRAALCRWVKSEKTTSANVLSALPAMAKASAMPGASIATKILIYIPEKILNSLQTSFLDNIISSFRNNNESNRFTELMSYHLMEILGEQLVLMDKHDSKDGFKVCESKLGKFVDALISRLLLFLFLKTPTINPKEAKRFFRNRSSLYEAARNTALSIIWFNPTGLTKVKGKAVQIEYLKETDVFSRKICSIPTTETLSRYRRWFLQNRDASRSLLEGFLKFKLDTEGYEGNRRSLTAEGFFQRAPIKCSGNYYKLSDPIKPGKYPPLTITERDREIIEYQSKKNLEAYSEEIDQSTRKTQSYREIAENLREDQSLSLPNTLSDAPNSLPLNPESNSATSSSNSIPHIPQQNLSIPSPGLNTAPLPPILAPNEVDIRAMEKRMGKMQKRIAGLEATKRFISNLETAAIERKIMKIRKKIRKISYYSLLEEEEWRAANEILEKRIINLKHFGTNNRKISAALMKEFKESVDSANHRRRKQAEEKLRIDNETRRNRRQRTHSF